MSSKPEHAAAICDANVLIDFATFDQDILREAVFFWKKIYVPDCILHEVYNLSETRAKELGLIIIPTPYREVVKLDNLSIQDSVCLHFVKQEKYICITNDKVLRKECLNIGGQVVWGLEMLLLLVSAGRVSKKRALDAAKRIYKENPTITETILENFIKKLDL